jgi:transcriptional pleiotropic regulator of transition state genes
MKRPIGMTRPIDQLGRVVIPKETRRMLGLETGDMVEFFVDDNRESIIINKYTPGCCFCDNMSGLKQIGEKYVCESCIAKLTNKL